MTKTTEMIGSRVETFDFGITNGSIHKDKDGFHPYVGGCGVGGPVTTIDGARKILFERLRDTLNWRSLNAQNEFKKINLLLNTLSDDPFNLGIFKK